MTSPGMQPSLRGQRVFVTGGRGFLGSFVLERLAREDLAALEAPGHQEVELRDGEQVARALLSQRPDVVIHLAARVGGIGANERHPGTFWRDNTLMGVNVLEGARRAEVRRVVVVGTACAYPKHAPIPFAEDNLWDGYPEETNAPYGVAKRSLAVGLSAYAREFGLGGAYLLPANLYGPRDNFDLETSHVIPAMIRKCEEARRAQRGAVELWGTGAASREFLYVEDCAEAIARAAATVSDPTPVNLGTGREITMRTLAQLVAQATGYGGRFVWNASLPDGQPRRLLEASRAREVLGWEATVPLEEGLRRTVAWFRQNPPASKQLEEQEK